MALLRWWSKQTLAVATAAAALFTGSAQALPEWHQGLHQDAETYFNIGLIDTRFTTDPVANEYLRNYLISYLDELSKSNHWQYHLITVTPEQGYKLVQAGKLDLLGPVIPVNIPALEKYSLTNGYSCYVLVYLYSRASDYSIEPDHGASLEGKTLGVINDEEMLSECRYYAQSHQWKVNFKVYDDWDRLYEALVSGEVDVMADDGTHVEDSEVHLMGSIDVFQAQFIAPRDHDRLVDVFNTAIYRQEIDNLSFENWLEAEYIIPALRHIARLNETQREFVKGLKVLTVALPPAGDPFVKTGGTAEPHGLYPWILERMAVRSKLRFKYLVAPSVEEALQMVYDGRADLALGAFSGVELSSEVYQTNAIRLEPFVAMGPASQDLPVNKGTGVQEFVHGAAAYVGGKHQAWQVHECSEGEECLDEVDHKQSSMALVPALELRRESLDYKHARLDRYEMLNVNIPINLVVGGPNARMLRNILNVAALKLDPVQIDAHGEALSRPNLMSYIIARHPYIFVLMGIIAILLVLVTYQVLLRHRLKLKQAEQLFAKNNELQLALNAAREMKLSRDAYKVASETDQLTDLLNKEAFRRLADEALERLSRDGQFGALIIIDVDHFKHINDQYGHQFGDSFLKGFSQNLHSLFRRSDLVGRFGGDEFCVLMTAVAVEIPAAQIFESVSIAAQNAIAGECRSEFTVSMGLAFYTGQGESYDEIFACADNALYEVKKAGRDGYCLYGKQVCSHQMIPSPDLRQSAPKGDSAQ